MSYEQDLLTSSCICLVENTSQSMFFADNSDIWKDRPSYQQHAVCRDVTVTGIKEDLCLNRFIGALECA